MKKDKLITIRVNALVRDKFNEWCTEQGLSASEFLSNIIEDCVTGNYEISSNNKEKRNKNTRQRLIALEARLEEISTQIASFTQIPQQEKTIFESASLQPYFEIANKVEVLEEQLRCISNQIENRLDRNDLEVLITNKLESIFTEKGTSYSPLEQTLENQDIGFNEDESSSNLSHTLPDDEILEVKKDDTNTYVKNLNNHIEVSAIEVKDETILTEDERIEMLKQGYSIVFDCHKGKDEKIKQYIKFKPEESLSSDKWVYVGTKTDDQWTENSIYGNYTGEKKNKIACEKFAVEFRKCKQLQAEALIELTGKALGCWCYPNPCHGQVLADFVNNAYKKQKDSRNQEYKEDKIVLPLKNDNNELETQDKEDIKELTAIQTEVMNKISNIPTGDKFSENGLAKKLEVSRTVLRNFAHWKSLFEIVEKKRGCDYVKL